MRQEQSYAFLPGMLICMKQSRDSPVKLKSYTSPCCHDMQASPKLAWASSCVVGALSDTA